MSQKILIDGISLLSPLTGIGRYTYEISTKIKNLKQYEVGFFYGYYSKNLLEPSTPSNIKGLKSIISKNKFLKKIARKTIDLMSNIMKPSYDLYWQPSLLPNININAKKIITTLHDFSFILYPEFHPKERIEYYEKYFFKNIIKSDIIITGSNYSKKEILQRIDFKEENVRVIYHGLNHNIFKIYDNISLPFSLPDNFILSVGSIEPRKNLLGLLKAYNMLSDNLKQKYKLILVGFQGWENDEIMEQINKNKENITYLGFISDVELAQVYNKADCFIFPSFYEGFGLPIIEAFACGTPVITSNTSSMPEVGGDAAIYCNPNDIADIKNKLVLILEDKELQKDMIQKGLKIAQKYSWERSAKQHQDIFKELLNEK